MKNVLALAVGLAAAWFLLRGGDGGEDQGTDGPVSVRGAWQCKTNRLVPGAPAQDLVLDIRIAPDGATRTRTTWHVIAEQTDRRGIETSFGSYTLGADSSIRVADGKLCEKYQRVELISPEGAAAYHRKVPEAIAAAARDAAELCYRLDELTQTDLYYSADSVKRECILQQ